MTDHNSKSLIRFVRSSAMVWLCAVLLLAGFGGLILIDQVDDTHGLITDVGRVSSSSSEPFRNRLAYLDANDIYRPAEPASGTMQGAIWLPRDGDYTFLLRTDGRALVTLDGETLIDVSEKGAVRTISVTFEHERGTVPVEISYQYDPEQSARALFDLWWKTPGGVARRVPAWALTPSMPGGDLIAGSMRMRAALIAAWSVLILGLIGLAAALIVRLVKGDIDWRLVLGLLILLLAAYGLRAGYITQRAAVDPLFYMLPQGSDHLAFESHSRGLMRGTWPTGGYYKMPGMSYVLYGLHLLMGPGMMAVRLATTLMGALLALMAYDTARLIFDERAGWVAGVLTAIFPSYVFYSGVLLSACAAIFFAGVLIWQMAILTKRASWGAVITAGVSLGLVMMLRQNMMVILPLAVVWLFLFLPDSRRKAALMSAVLVVVTVLVFLPIPLHNASVGADYLSTPLGAQAFYQGNNRDSAGFYNPSQAWQTAMLLGGDYYRAFFDDLRAEPGRWIGLMLHKLGMFWQPQEGLTNLSYATSGTEASWVLRTLAPFNWAIMGALGLSGLVLTVVDKRRDSWYLGLFVLLMMGTITVYTPESRIRVPTAPGIVPLAAFALVALFDALRPKIDRARLVTLLKVAGGVGVVMVLLGAANRTLPRPRLLREEALPAEVIPLNVDFGEQIRLVGYEIERGAEGVDPGEPFLITFYWQRLKPIDMDYSVFLLLLDRDGEEWGRRDIPIGLVSYQYYQTSDWRNDRIFKEEYMIEVDRNAPVPLATDLLVGVYDKETLTRLPINGGESDSLLIVRVRIAERAAVMEGEATIPLDYNFGGWATLAGATLEQDGGALDLTVYWDVAGTPPADYLTFLHVLDESGTLVAQGDGFPMEGVFPTGVWRAGDRLVDTYHLELPPDLPAGEYSLNLGLHDTVVRVPVTDKTGAPVPDNSATIVTVTVD
ncbi:MAG: glycosyltransferase family 39 protein [Anaerolineae bacterium]|nr:glycosyltransferase family 39 protein [Anaerolineae bacterium]